MVVLTECTDSVSVFLQLYCLTIDVTGSMDVLVNALFILMTMLTMGVAGSMDIVINAQLFILPVISCRKV